jgi:hypothetical protein
MGGNFQTGDLAGLLDSAIKADNRRREREAADALSGQTQNYREQDREQQEKRQASEQARQDLRDRATQRSRSGGSGLTMSGSLLLGNAARAARDRAAESAAYEQEDQNPDARTEQRTAPRTSLLARGAATYGNRRIS